MHSKMWSRHNHSAVAIDNVFSSYAPWRHKRQHCDLSYAAFYRQNHCLFLPGTLYFVKCGVKSSYARFQTPPRLDAAPRRRRQCCLWAERPLPEARPAAPSQPVSGTLTVRPAARFARPRGFADRPTTGSPLWDPSTGARKAPHRAPVERLRWLRCGQPCWQPGLDLPLEVLNRSVQLLDKVRRQVALDEYLAKRFGVLGENMGQTR